METPHFYLPLVNSPSFGNGTWILYWDPNFPHSIHVGEARFTSYSLPWLQLWAQRERYHPNRPIQLKLSIAIGGKGRILHGGWVLSWQDVKLELLVAPQGDFN